MVTAKRDRKTFREPRQARGKASGVLPTPKTAAASGEPSTARHVPVFTSSLERGEVWQGKMDGDPVSAVSRMGGDEQGERFSWLWKSFRKGRVGSREDARELALGGAWSLVEWCRRQWAWSDETFGPGKRTKGIIAHIRKELKEVAKTPDDLEEWVDIMILAMDGFRRHGGTPSMLLESLDQKQRKNFARRWPDWREVDDEDVAIEHDRSEE